MLIDESTFITVYMNENDCFRCHALRLVLAHKQIDYSRKFITNLKRPPPDLEDLGGDIHLPVLVDRHLCIDDLLVTAEYLDERFPYPAMMPSDPAQRARMRMSLIYVYHQWGHLVDEIKASTTKTVANRFRKRLLKDFTNSSSLFRKRYAGGNEFGLLDCIVAPILWRLPGLGMKLEGRATERMRAYQKRVFDNPMFRNGMIESDNDLHTVAS